MLAAASSDTVVRAASGVPATGYGTAKAGHTADLRLTDAASASGYALTLRAAAPEYRYARLCRCSEPGDIAGSIRRRPRTAMYRTRAAPRCRRESK